MNAFPLLAAFTLCVSFAILSASFADLREAPLVLDRGMVPSHEIAAREAMPAGTSWTPSSIIEANEGLLDREFASDDPVQAWLDRYLAPPSK